MSHSGSGSISDSKSTFNMHINIDIDIQPPKKHAMRPPMCTRPQIPHSHTHSQKPMRFHPDSPFGQAWAAHYKAANLARLSDEEKRVEYNRFSAEWEEKMGRGPVQFHSA